jgi:MEMO1 family protein
MSMMNRETCWTTVLCLLVLLTCCTQGNGSEQGTSAERVGEMGPATRSSPGISENVDASDGQKPRGGHPSSIAGSWYPEDPEKLRRLLEGNLAQVPAPDPTEASHLIAVISPHAGYAYCGLIAAHAYRWVQERRPRRILLMGPSHYANFRGISFGDYAYFETPLGRVPVDPAGREILRGCDLVSFHQGPHQQEHSLDIQLPFLQVLFPESPPSILPLLVGHLEQEDYPVLASALAKVLDHETIVVVSSDFTHYGPRFGYVPFPNDRQVAEKLRSLDQGAWEKILGLDRNSFLSYCEATGITICGSRPIALLLELLPRDTEPRKLSYTTSGQGTGDYTNSVSYCSLAFTRKALWEQERGGEGSSPERQTTMKKGKKPSQASAMDEGSLTPSEKSTLLRLARDTLEEYVQKREKPDPQSGRYEITPTLRERRGAFVTLKESGTLRGCIGYIQPIEPLYATVQENAINAATRDSRFSPVRPSELESIEIEISALTAPEPVSSYRDIVLGKHGIILKKGSHQAVFLPQVAPEQGWDLPQTLRHLSMKAGLPEDAWMDPKAEFRVFTAEVFKEE